MQYAMTNQKNIFTLNSTNIDFQQRQKNVFDQLNQLETTIRSSTTPTDDAPMEVDNTTPQNTRRTSRAATKHFRGKESIFKKPQNPVPKNYYNRIPDFKKNPHKWTKYTLDDVRDEDISDRANTKAALSFLKELEGRARSSSGGAVEDGQVLSTRIVFNKHGTSLFKGEVCGDGGDKATFRSSKVVMPEYVVGQKIQKDKKNRKVQGESKGKELKLGHLLEEDDDAE